MGRNGHAYTKGKRKSRGLSSTAFVGLFLFHHAGDFGSEIVFFFLDAFAFRQADERFHRDVGAEFFRNVRHVRADRTVEHVVTHERLLHKANLFDLFFDTAFVGFHEDRVSHKLVFVGNRDFRQFGDTLFGEEVEEEFVIPGNVGNTSVVSIKDGCFVGDDLNKGVLDYIKKNKGKLYTVVKKKMD